MKNLNRSNRNALVAFVLVALLAAVLLVWTATRADGTESTCTPVNARHYSWTGGPLDDGVVPPPPPGGSWQANTQQEPHLNNPNVTWLGTPGTGLHYTSHGSSGKADWFYFQPAVTCPPPTEPPTPTETPTTEPPTPTETPTTEPPTPTETPTTTPPVTTPTEVPTDTSTPSEQPQPTPVAPTPTTPTQPPQPQPEPETSSQQVQCVNGVWVTTVNGQVISRSGTCDRATVTSQQPTVAEEEGL